MICQKSNNDKIVITAGSTYLDIDAYACMVSMAELLKLQGINAIAYSKAPCNYSVCQSLVKAGQVLDDLPPSFVDEAAYIIVDVSDPAFLKDSVPLGRVVAIYDHHVGFEKFWQDRINENSHIEFIGAAATLVFREWKKSGLADKMSPDTAYLLMAAILDNTLNLTSSNTTKEDIYVYNELCEFVGGGQNFAATYLSAVQQSIESDLKISLFGDIKTNHDNEFLPKKIAQLCVWDSESILEQLSMIREWFAEKPGSWMINIIDIKHHCSFFVCDDIKYQKDLERIFDVRFEWGITRTSVPYLRKEIIKKMYTFKLGE